MSVNLAKIELKLLVVFDALIAERNVTRAAHRLGMSQPALSNALNRLRSLLNNQLFVRTGNGMIPTRKAEDLAEAVQGALRQLEVALEPTTFEALEVEWTFDLAVSDYASVVLLPSLIAHVAEAAPGVKLRITSKPNGEVLGLLDANEADVAIGIIPDLPGRFGRADLFGDRYVCMMRQDHPLAGRPLDLAGFTAAEHLAIKPGTDEVSRADRLLERNGVRRRTITTVHQFLAAPAIVARSEMIVLVFERMISAFDAKNFYFCRVPVADMGVRISAVWNQAQSGRAAHKWLRRQIAAVGQSLANGDRSGAVTEMPSAPGASGRIDEAAAVEVSS